MLGPGGEGRRGFLRRRVGLVGSGLVRRLEAGHRVCLDFVERLTADQRVGERVELVGFMPGGADARLRQLAQRRSEPPQS